MFDLMREFLLMSLQCRFDVVPSDLPMLAFIVGRHRFNQLENLNNLNASSGRRAVNHDAKFNLCLFRAFLI